MKILIVDDEKDIQPLFMQRFRKERKNGELEFHFAISGEEAIEFLENANGREIAMVFSDINMPGMNGFELLEIIRKRFSEIKVVMVSAYGNDNYYQTAMKFGANDYMVKPIDFQMLKDKFLS